MTGTQLDEVGNTEMLTWATMFGAIGGSAGELHRLHPDLASRSLHDAVPAAAGAQDATPSSALEQYGGFTVPEPGLPVLQASAGRGLRI